MAGAGGIFLILIGVLVGILGGVVAVVLFAFGFRALPPAAGRVAAIVVGGLEAFAILLTLPAWIVLISGKDTRGEAFDYSGVPFWFYLLLLVPPITLASLVAWAALAARSSLTKKA